MNALLERLTSAQLVEIITITIGGIVAVVGILALTKYQLQLLSDDTELKREKQQAELALRTKMIERAEATGGSLDALLALDAVPPTTPRDADTINAEMAKRFGNLDISPEEIEQTLSRVMTLDTSRKQAIINAIDGLFESEAEHESILAAVRGLCSSATTKEPEMPVSLTGV